MGFLDKFKEEVVLVPKYVQNVEETIVDLVKNEVDSVIKLFQDDSVKMITSLVEKLGEIVLAKTKEVEDHVISLNLHSEAKSLAEAEIAKAKDAISKLTNSEPLI